MINLIPNHEKKKKMKDFYFRFTIVLFILLGFCALVGAASLLPTLFLSGLERNLAHTKLLAQKNEPPTLADRNLSETVTDLDRKLKLVESAAAGRYLVSQRVIRAITLRKMSDIQITRIAFENSPVNGKQVDLSGLAPSRERLLLFRQALENDTAFQKVDLPISNFVKGSNIQFSLSLTPS